jgi:hypothetical protein
MDTLTTRPASSRRVIIKAALVASLASVPLVLAPSAHAAMDQISGVGVLAGEGECTSPPGTFTEYTLVMSGELVGCLYTDILTAETKPSGVYLETGVETFVGSVNGGLPGTFTTTYKFEAKFAPDGSEIHGRCQHPIVDGSGTGGFEGASGRINFKDDVETGEFFYKGHIDLA